MHQDELQRTASGAYVQPAAGVPLVAAPRGYHARRNDTGGHGPDPGQPSQTTLAGCTRRGAVTKGGWPTLQVQPAGVEVATSGLLSGGEATAAGLVTKGHGLLHEEHPPIDLVYTWAGDPPIKGTTGVFSEIGDRRQRYNGELQYVLRSAWKHVRWVNHVYILVNTDVLADRRQWAWLADGSDTSTLSRWITLVDRCKLFDNWDHCPTSVGYGADSVAHRIPGLSNLFVQSDDDLFFARDLAPSYFFRQRVVTCAGDATRLCSEWVPVAAERHDVYPMYDKDPPPPPAVTYPKTKWAMFAHNPSPVRRDQVYAFNAQYTGWLAFLQSHNKVRYGEHHPQYGLLEEPNMAVYEFLAQQTPPGVIAGAEHGLIACAKRRDCGGAGRRACETARALQTGD